MKTLLIVEDEFSLSEALASVLSEEGYCVLLAGNGRQGLERAAERRPDLVLTDLMMPLMDGRAMIQALRADPALEKLPIILMSAVDGRLALRDLPGIPFVRKPFDLDTLLALISAALQ